MNIDIARDKARKELSDYAAKLEAFGLVTSLEEEYETKDFDESSYEAEDLSIVTVGLTVRTKDMKEDDGIIFGFVIDVNKDREIDEESFEKNWEEEKETLDDLIAALNGQTDVDAFIKGECERVKAEGEEAIADLTKNLNRINMASKIAMIAGGIILCVALICALFIR